MALGEKLGKLSIAILENFVEDKLGKKFVDELRAPTDRAIAVATALGDTEDRFKKEFDDQELAHAMFVDLPADEKILGAAVGKFYDHPTDPDFQQSLEQILTGAFKKIPKERINKAVDLYIKILKEELALADEKFRENVRALADLHGEESQRELVEILKRIEPHLSAKPEHLVLRSLHQLPPAPADFTGREEQLKQILDALAQHKGVAISGLTGMGGIGKTVLGLVAAHRIESQYKDAQIFLDLKGVTEPLSASDALRHVILSFEPQADLREANEDALAALYQSLLTDKKVLVFMDNARDAAQVRSLIPPESCALIVTSRWHFTLPHMDPLRLDVLPENQAIDLLHELCKRIGGMGKDIAVLCGYLPLALRIAGTFLAEHNDWMPKEYVERLKVKGLKLLQGEGNDAKLNLELILGYSYEQLTQDEQKYWRMLAVFRASFKRDAAAAVWELDEDAARDLLSNFNRMSLLDYDEKPQRYYLHDLLTEFTRTKLSEEENFNASFRYTSFYLSVLQVSNRIYSQGKENVLTGLRLLDSEWVHVLTAQKWSTSNSDELCNEFPNAGYMILSLRLLPREQISWLESGLISAQNLKNKEYQGFHLSNLGIAYSELGDQHKAIQLHEQQLAIARELGNRHGESIALGNLGIAYEDLNETRRAIQFHEQALAIDREVGNLRSEGADLNNLGESYMNIGDAQKAIQFLESALVISRKTGDYRSEGLNLRNLGSTYFSTGNVKMAIEFYEQDLKIAQDMGNKHSLGSALLNLGVCYAAAGDTNKAIGFFMQALVISREVGNRLGEANALGDLGVAYENLGDVRKAIQLQEQRLAISSEIGDRLGKSKALINMSHALYGLGEKENAIKFAKQALEICEAIESPSAQMVRNLLKEWGGGD